LVILCRRIVRGCPTGTGDGAGELPGRSTTACTEDGETMHRPGLEVSFVYFGPLAKLADDLISADVTSLSPMGCEYYNISTSKNSAADRNFPPALKLCNSSKNIIVVFWVLCS